MDFLQHNLLTLIIFLPAAGAIVVLLAKGREAARWTAVGTTLLTFALSLLLLAPFRWRVNADDSQSVYGYNGYASAAGSGNPAGGDSPFGVVQMVQRADWIQSFNIQYLVGIDGLSFPLVLLTTFICVLACVASWDVEKMTKGYFALFLFLETGILGVFLSLDFFLFYVFFEVSLLPMYFLIGVWGGPRKEYAAIKFFLYTLVGSICLLVVLIGVFLYSKEVFPGGTFDLVKLSSPAMHKAFAGAGLAGVARAFFLLAMVCFMIKLPSVPFHTWLPDAHVEAPTPISMILAALLLKMGGYGIFRVAFPLFPDAAKYFWMPIAVVGVVSILYGALCAMAQTDFKKLVAYSSISHMGFVVLGAAMMTTASVNGALFMMVAHGVTSAMMFFIVGVAYDRARHRDLDRFGGLATTMPVYAGLSMVGFFANLGLPALCGFVGEVMVLLGSFAAARGDSVLSRSGVPAGHVYPLAVIACLGVVLNAGYMLWALQRVFFGPEKPEYKDFPEVTRREVAVLAPLAAMAVLLGILPGLLFFAFTNQTVAAMFKVFS